MQKNIFAFLFLVLLSSTSIANPISKHIKQTDFEGNSKVALYVVQNDTKKVLYSKNETMPLNPASAIKPIIVGMAYQVLGNDYNFETKLLKDKDNNYYIKLGGDIFLNQKDLNHLFANLKNQKINKIYIDDSIFEAEQYPLSWLEEDKWPTMAEISPYIINSNVVQIGVNRSSLSKKINVIQNDEYKFPIINELKEGEFNDIKIVKLYGENSSIINLQGSVAKDDVISLPVLKPDINFNIRINEALNKNNVVYNDRISVKKTPNEAYEIANIKRPLEKTVRAILYDSNNYASEILFRISASKYFNKTANLDDSIQLFNKMFGYLLLNGEQIADGSGVSRQNFLSVRTLYRILDKISSKVDIYSMLPSANEGTLAQRMLFLQGNLKAKTGTLKNYSSLVAEMKTRKNTNISFVSIVQNSTKRKPLLKHYENLLLGIIYKNY